LIVAPVTARHTFRMAFHFGLFQFLMPIIGWYAGQTVAAWMSGVDHWIAFGLLGYVGGKMLWESRKDKTMRPQADPTRGWMLLTLSVATSIDALAVGFSLAMLKYSVWFPSVVIGVVACALSALGIVFGGRIGPRWGHWAEVAGGCVLLGIGAKILWDHCCGG
jgi:putative Mn2+ efflux pump MntP